MSGDADHAEDCDRGKPYQHDGPKDPADPRRALALNDEQQDQDRYCQGHDSFVELRGINLGAFDRAQHRNGWCDGAVTIEQRSPHEPQHDQGCTPSAGLRAPGRNQRKQREDSPLAVIVGAHDQNGVFDGDNEHKSP